jgi:hypothetical protein
MADSDKDTVPTAQFESAPQAAGRAAKSIKVGSINAATRKVLQETNKSLIIWPWNKYYISWWSLTVAGALFTIFTETYAIAFSPAGLYPYGDAASIIEYILDSIFFIDIMVTFHLVYYDDDKELVLDKKKIARHYLKGGMFWRDFAGVFPFYAVALAITGELGHDSKKAQYLALLRLVKLVRLHRAKQLFDSLQYNTHVSLMSFTLIRNFCFALVWSHFSACVFYFIARQFDFDPDDTWIGGSLNDRNKFERYVTSLYWSVVTVRKRMCCVEFICMFYGANKLTMLRLSSCFPHPFAFSKPF